MEFLKHLNPQPRPYWHVDAKWICGILLFFLLAANLLLTSLVKITDEKNGPTIAALVIGAAFVRGDEAQAKADARVEIAKQGGAIKPLPNFPDVVITEKDLDLPVRDIKLKVFKPIAESIYNDGVEATAARYAKTPEEKDKFVRDAFFFKPFTKEFHQGIKSFSKTLLIISILLLLAFIYFCAGWGRLANPGLLLLAVSLPGSFIALAITHAPKDQTGAGSSGGIPADLTQEIGSLLGHYHKVAILGVLLLLAAFIGKTVSRIFFKKRHIATK